MEFEVSGSYDKLSIQIDQHAPMPLATFGDLTLSKRSSNGSKMPGHFSLYRALSDELKV